jgi:hypothetical protein
MHLVRWSDLDFPKEEGLYHFAVWIFGSVSLLSSERTNGLPPAMVLRTASPVADPQCLGLAVSFHEAGDLQGPGQTAPRESIKDFGKFGSQRPFWRHSERIREVSREVSLGD